MPEFFARTRVNGAIAKGTAKTKAGKTVTDKLVEGLVRADKQVVYAIRDGIPVLLVDEGIVL